MSNSNKEQKLYQNDVVYRFDKRGKIILAIVMDTHEESFDLNDSYTIKKGQVRVQLNNGSREIVWKENCVHLLNRYIIPGDIVHRSKNGKDMQKGYCKDLKQYSTVEIIGTNRVVEAVFNNRLQPISRFQEWNPICLRDRYGRVENFDQQLTMLSKCGSLVKVRSNINDHITDYFKRNKPYSQSFYVGQEVICVPNDLKEPKWISQSKHIKRNMVYPQYFKIIKVEVKDIDINWYDSMHFEFGVFVKATDIKRLKTIESEDNYIEIGVRRFLTLSPSDVFLKKSDWIKKLSSLYSSKNHKNLDRINKNRNNFRTHKMKCLTSNSTSIDGLNSEEGWVTEECDEEEPEIPNSRTTEIFLTKLVEHGGRNTFAVDVLFFYSKVTVVWQDGTEEKNIPTTDLCCSMSLDDHEFFPGEWVVRDGKLNEQYGVIQHVNHLERTALVKWFASAKGELQPTLVLVEDISVYDLKKHEKYAFRPGSVVIHIPTKKHMLGYVLDSYPEGYVTVKWLNNTEENCWPHNLELLPMTMDYSTSESDDESTSPFSWKTESIESIPGDLTYETTLQNVASLLSFVRDRIDYLKGLLKQQCEGGNFSLLKEILMIYDNSSYLDKLLNTEFFSLKNENFQDLLTHIKETAKTCGLEVRGRIFYTIDNLGKSSSKPNNPEQESVIKLFKVQQKVEAQYKASMSKKEAESTKIVIGTTTCYLGASTSTPASEGPWSLNNICTELLGMVKIGVDLAYAEITKRIDPKNVNAAMKSSEATPISLTPSSSVPTTPTDSTDNKLIKPVITYDIDICNDFEDIFSTHYYYFNKFEPIERSKFIRAVERELTLLHKSLPSGIWVRCSATRMDLFSVMIRGPSMTPYEDGLFIFDIQLSRDYPKSPPTCHYISYSSERFNPNLYVEGKVCISLLGTWLGHDVEVWNANSNLLQLFVSIQGLILVPEPYFNEAGYERQIETQQGQENSRIYNELVILKLVQSMSQLLLKPPPIFKEEVQQHFKLYGAQMIERIESWCNESCTVKAEFPLLPVSKGLKLSLKTALNQFREALKKVLN